MSDNRDHFPAISVRLSRVLDELGMNTLTVRRRRQAYLFREKLITLGKNVDVYHFGSQTEGTTTPGLGSDVDTLVCQPHVRALQKWSDWQRSKLNLLMLQEDTAPGYSRLQLLRSDIPMATENLPDEDFTHDRRGRVIMNNTVKLVKHSGSQLTRNGPAQTQSGEKLLGESDYVSALKCNSWPIQAEQWTTKCRRGNWPTQGIIQKATKSGFFLVPVGYKLSQTESLEWRISLSSTERLLMFSMNITQLKCYVVLKMLMKSLVIPYVGESISSYHCKTAVFYSIEDTGTDFWMEYNLLEGVTKCLSLLLGWIRNAFGPHFIMPESNLFVGKINSINRRKLMSILKYLIASDGRFLLLIPTDELGNRLKLKLSSSPDQVPILGSYSSVSSVGLMEVKIIYTVSTSKRNTLVDLVNLTPVTAIQSVRSQISAACDRIRGADIHERQASNVYLEFLICLFCSIITSAFISCRKGIPKEALKWFCIGANCDIASKLKLASAFFCNGDLRKADLILQEVQVNYKRKLVLPVCGCYRNILVTDFEFCRQMHALENKEERSRHFAHCVMFSPHEINCVPAALRSEMHRSIGDDVQHREPYWDNWMVLAVADSLSYLYYLQYITYRQLGKCSLKMRSLHNLERCVRECDGHRHLETSWNLLGQCMELEKNAQAALDCYRTSLEIRPRNNAANWHIPILVYRCISGNGQMRDKENSE